MATPSFILGGEKGWPIKEGKLLGYAQDENGLYRPIPVNFTRNSKSWVDRNGTLLEKAANVPTIGGTGTGKLVLQPERTNKQLDSNTFNGSGWVSAGSTVTQAAITFRGKDAVKYDRLNPNWSSSLYTDGGTASVNAHMKTIYSKYIDIQYLKFISDASQVTLSVDLLNKSIDYEVNSTNLDDATVEAVEDGWVKITLYQNDLKARYFYMSLNSVSGGSLTNTSSLGSCFLAFSKVTEGPYPTEPIITDGAAVTRLKDNISPLSLAGIMDGTSGAIYCHYKYAETNQAISLGVSSQYNMIGISVNYAVGRYETDIRQNGGVNTSNITSATLDSSTPQKVIITWGNGKLAAFVSGVKIGEESITNFSSGELQNLYLSRPNGIHQFEAEVEEIRLYDSLLDDAESISLTTL